MNLQNQIAIVTGGASGMGAATARWLTKAGVKVAIWDVNKESAEKVAAELQGIAIICDITQETSVVNALAETKEKLGVPRICINCAGIAPGARLVKRDGPMPLTDFQRVIQINLVGTFNVMRVAAAEMSQLKPLSDGEHGVIINTASVAAFEGQIGQVAYSASKAGVVGMMLPAARELAQFGIRVITIAPGLVDTPMFAGLPETTKTNLAEAVPFPKRLGKPEEFANLVLHVIENSYLNGCVIRLDGAPRMQSK
jgi:NAD(P)-dependent dehydrogenase (short-subunit alcohol dehydrogenase family)